MGYIFDAMKRSEPQGGAAQPHEPQASLPPLEQLAEATPSRADDLDAQLDELNSQVAELASELHDPSEPVLETVGADGASESLLSPGGQKLAVSTETPSGVSDHAQPESYAMPAIQPVGQPASRLDDRLVVLREPGSLMTEEYRSIRTQLLARCRHQRRLIHTITSATPQEGKTITSMNLGLSFAELRNRAAIVIEADLRLPTFSKLVDLPEGPGMIQYLQGEVGLDAVVRGIEGSRLHVIPAGGRCSSTAIQLLSGPRMVQLLRELRERYDHVIIDTPPVTELADAGILGALSDEVMLVVRMNRTPQTLVDQAIRTLRGYNAPVAGVIATDQQRSRRKYYYYRYGYRYRYYTKDAA